MQGCDKILEHLEDNSGLEKSFKMHTPLIYQSTEYDAAPIAVINALHVLFSREEVPSAAVKAIYQYTLDQIEPQGIPISCSTSASAMQFLSGWINRFSKSNGLPLLTESYSGLEVFLGPGCRLYGCLRSGGVAVLKIWYRGQGHYVTVTGMDQDSLYLFDPYYREKAFSSPDIQIVNDQPFRYNRCVAISRMTQSRKQAYAAHEVEDREMLLFYRLSDQPGRSPEEELPDDWE